MRDAGGGGGVEEARAEWSGPRERVKGPAVVIGAVVIALIALAILVTLTRSPDIIAQLSQDYVRMMAGQLAPAIDERDPEALAAALGAHLPETPRITLLAPDFNLRGGRRHDVDGRPAAAWFYEAATADLAIAEAVDVRAADLPEADEVRDGAGPPLRIYRKQTQTLVVWEEGQLVYVFISTLPGEQVIALAQRLAAPAPGGEDPA